MVTADDFEPVATHIFDAESDFLDSDAVFAVKPSLVKQFVRRADDDPERPDCVTGPWWSLEMEFVLAPASEEKP